MPPAPRRPTPAPAAWRLPRRQGDGVSCQANIMASATVWPAMLTAFTAAEGTLTHRLLTALDAAEAAGGDLRGVNRPRFWSYRRR